MATDIDYYKDEEGLTEAQSQHIIVYAVLGGYMMTLIPRMCHEILIPQVLEEGAYFIGKCSYGIMYLLAAPMGAVLGASTFLAVTRYLKKPQSAAHGLSATGIAICGLACIFLFQAFRPTDPILKQDSLYYILSVNVPWLGPILLWSLFMVFWSLQIRRRYRLGMTGFFSSLNLLVIPLMILLDRELGLFSH